MKYKKMKVIGIGLISIFCMFMINVQNVSAAKYDKAYVKITNKIGGNFTSWQPKTTCD
ncbi:MAG: hypothetical protein RR378_08115 [Erysipelotrichaceae bacterium]